MSQADFVYAPANDPAPNAIAVSIFADRGAIREQMRGDVAAAGLRIRECAELATLLSGEPRALGEVILLDCPQVDGACLAALARLDIRARRSGAQLVIATSLEGLEDVFGCCDQSQPQILVDPSRAERILALGRVLANVSTLHLRELGEDDRLTLLRLTEQVGRIAERLEGLDKGSGNGVSAFRFESPAPAYRGDPGNHLVRTSRPALPDPRLVRRIIRQRQLRARFFDGELFADPAWDILLDLTAARAEHRRVSVTSLCIASGVPPTTALRWIGQMTCAGLLERVEDDSDRRRAFVGLSDTSADGMARYFAELEGVAVAQVA